MQFSLGVPVRASHIVPAVIEDRQPRRGFRDNAAEYQQFEDDGPDPAWPTAGHRPPGYDAQGPSESYAYEQSGHPDEESAAAPRRATHADGDRDDADDLRYGPPTDRYSVLAELAYDPSERDQASPPAGGHEVFGDQQAYDEREPYEEPHPYASERRPAFERQPAFEQPQEFEQPQASEQPQAHASDQRQAYARQPAFDRQQAFEEPHPYEQPQDLEQPDYEQPHPYERQDSEQPHPNEPQDLEQPPGYDQREPADALYRRGYGQDEPHGHDDQATAVHQNQYEPAEPQQAGLPWSPSPVLLPPAETGQPTDVIDLSVPRVLPRTHRGEQRKRALIVTVAAAGVLLAGGAGYAIFGTGSEPAPTPADAAPAEAPTENPSFPDQPTEPTADPAVTTPATGASPSVSPSASITARQPVRPRTSATTRSTTGGTIKPLPTPKPTTKKPTTPTKPPPVHTTPPSSPSTTPSESESSAPPIIDTP